METIAEKKHYLLSEFTGFENTYNTKVTSVEEDENVLVITMRVNPTTDELKSLSDRVETIVTYNLNNDTFRIVCEGKGSRKYGENVKYDAGMIIEFLVENTKKNYKSDCSDSLRMTIAYYYNKLKEIITDKETLATVSNEFDYKANHEAETVEEINELFNLIVKGLKVEDAKEIETFQLHDKVFNSYSDAFNYACDNNMNLLMILSSKHHTMTYERLKHLSSQYILLKRKMKYEEMKEYLEYLNSVPETLDKQEISYKLKSWLTRYEGKEQRQVEQQEEYKRLAIAVESMLHDLYSIGVTKKETKSLVKYYLNGEIIYQWFSGITTEKMYDELLEVYETYYIEEEPDNVYFDQDKMKRFVQCDPLIKLQFDMLGQKETSLQAIFNSEVLGCKAMEEKYLQLE